MRNEIIYDKKGIPSVMVVFTPEELGNGPACKVKGRTVKEIAISKYPNTMIGGLPYSMPYQKPATNIPFDDAVKACEDKGEGWHLMTNAEWAALAHISKKNSTLPRGNTNGGKSHSHPEETGTTYSEGGKTLAGSGPATWNHDHTPEGVADLCGNILEMVGGLRWIDGQVQIIPDNNAAAGADQSRESSEWVPVCTTYGASIYYNIDGGEITLTDEKLDDCDYEGIQFKDLDSEIEVPELLKELALYPDDNYEGKEYFWLDSEGERLAFRGGYWGSTSAAGVFCLNGNNPRSYVSTGVGFRSAFIRYSEIGQSDNPKEEQEETTKPQIEPHKDESQNHSIVEIYKTLTAALMTKVYRLAGGADPESFKELIMQASISEINTAAQLTTSLTQAALSTKALREAETEILSKEVINHE